MDYLANLHVRKDGNRHVGKDVHVATNLLVISTASLQTTS